MSIDDRRDAFENKFANDEELRFKVIARRNKLLGLWVAERMGKSGPDAEAYAKEVVLADFEEIGEEDVVRKVLKDAEAAGLGLNAEDIHYEMEKLVAIAKEQLMQGV